MRALAVLVCALLAGCATDGDGEANPTPTAPESQSFEHRIWLTEGGDLSLAQPEETLVPLQWSWGEWLAGTMPPLWQGQAQETPFVVTKATVVIEYAMTSPVVSTETRPVFTMWFGAGDSIIEHGFTPGPPLVAGREVALFEVDPLPLGGLVVDANTPLTLHVGSYFSDGAPTGWVSAVMRNSYIDIEGHNVSLPPKGEAANTSTSVELQGGRCVADLNQAGAAMATVDFDVHNASAIDATVSRTGPGGSDIDFFISDASGTRVSYAAGPSAPESLYLRQPNLALAQSGTWTLTVYNCQPQLSTVTIDINVFE